MAGMTDKPDQPPGHEPGLLRPLRGDETIGYGKPPRFSRFRAGQSGNPRGRRRNLTAESDSAFTLILGKTVRNKGQGKSKDHGIEEALQLRTYQEALKGRSMAIREVLRWILKRETWIAKNRPKPRKTIELKGVSHDPDNADEDLLRLGIAALNPARADHRCTRAQLLLEPWATKAALHRLKRRRFSAKDLDEIRRCTRDDGTINWPKHAQG